MDSQDSPAKRKLTTILAADVVGFSSMMNTDEERTHALLRKCRDIIDYQIARYDGRIFNTAGDSVMAEFGSAVSAVRCAIDFQEQLQQLNASGEQPAMLFRVGINVGDVLVEGEDLIGDGVNIAARMESIAAPGGICISGSVHELVRNKLSFTFEDMGRRKVKNIAAPISAFSLRPDRGAQTDNMANTASRPRKCQRVRRIVITTVIMLLVVLLALVVVKKIRQKNAQPAQRPISASDSTPVHDENFFLHRSVEGRAEKTGDRFTIFFDNDGVASVTIYPRRSNGVRKRAIGGQWWVSDEGNLCFRLDRIARDISYCGKVIERDGRTMLSSVDKPLPPWPLLPKPE